jgi:hypothetical protein
MAKLPSIPGWASPALQGLAYWLGSQHALRLAANVSEGAIGWELSRLLFTHLSESRFLEAEILYRHIREFNEDGDLDGSKERADLVIAKVRRSKGAVSYNTGDVEVIIEIKHNRSRKALVWEDINFLGARRKKTKAIRAFLIYASLNERPDDFTSPDGAAIKPRTKYTPGGKTAYRVRRVCRAISRIPSRNKMAIGHYAVLIEVAPSGA